MDRLTYRDSNGRALLTNKGMKTYCSTQATADVLCKYEELLNADKQCHYAWIHREDMDFNDERGVLHQKYMCQKCGFIHDFLDGHTSQYQYCPQCGSFLGKITC